MKMSCPPKYKREKKTTTLFLQKDTRAACQMCYKTHLSFLLVEIVNDDADEEVEREEGAKNDEHHKVQVHVEVDFSDWLFLHLEHKIRGYHGIRMDPDLR